MSSAITKRDDRWDILKFFLIFLVVLGHIADIYADVSRASGILRFIIYTFHMPLFIFISGLFGKRTVKERRWDRMGFYLILYVFIKVLSFVSKWIVNGTKPHFSLFSDGSVPWYVFCLFAFSVITVFADRFDPKKVFVFSVLLALIAGYDNDIGDFLCLSRIIVFYPFYFAGYCLEPGRVADVLGRKKYRIAGAVSLAVCIALIILLYDYIKDFKFMFSGRNPFGVIRAGWPFSSLARLVCYAVSCIMGLSFAAVIPKKIKLEFVAKTGARSVQIYALHFFIKILYFGLINDRFGVEKLFVSRLLIYEIIVAVALTAITALPFWSVIFDKWLRLPYKKNYGKREAGSSQ